jgi:probable rRNA maturation factor
MHVSVTNLQKRKIKSPAIRRLAEFLLEKAGKRAGIEWGEVSVVLVDDRQSQEVNRAHLGHDYATDVISFNFEPMPGELGTGETGEIVINVEYAWRLGPTYKGAYQELALYLAHGCDHLSGADDNTPQRRLQMRRRELRWLKEAQRNGLWDPDNAPLTLALSLKGRGNREPRA